jgi:hypothetical protein
MMAASSFSGGIASASPAQTALEEEAAKPGKKPAKKK